jgi:NADH-quinone oxidoreductase subunit J
MNLVDIVFYFFAVIIVASAAVVVLSKNIMYSAFSLLFTFFGVAGIYVLLNADFIAVTQLMIYIGGILVLIIFGVMLTTKITGLEMKTGITGKAQYAIGGLSTLVLGGTLIYVFNSTSWFKSPSVPTTSTVEAIGASLLTNYLLPFEAASVLLLLAMIGAALIARRK